jgi:hypothetical protein
MMTSGTINLDPEYQRGTYFAFGLCLFHSELIIGSLCLVYTETGKFNRLSLP